MDSIIVKTVAKRLGVSSERVFGLAFEYSEICVPKRYVLYQFLEWFYSGIIHSAVEDFCIDVMAGRVTCKVKKTKTLKRKNRRYFNSR